MATEIELAPDRTKLMISTYESGALVDRDRFDPASAVKRKTIARRLGVTDVWLLARCEEVRTGGVPVRVAVPGKDTAGGWWLRVRPIEADADAAREDARTGEEFITQADGLAAVPVTEIVEWGNREALCCLDVDYHDSVPPPRDWLTAVVTTRVVPKPVAWHFSRGGGLHLFYVAGSVCGETLTADELASIAALRFRAIDGVAGLELKTQVRGPGHEPVRLTHAKDSGVGLVEWFGSPEYDTEDRDRWLESEGMELGQRYDHTRCPINPTPGYTSTGNPVVVGEAGVYCHRCAGESRSLGCRRVGFAPWPAILGSPSSGDLGLMVRSLTHWGHAQYVLRHKYGLPDAFARLAYRAALKSYHADREATRPLIPLVFHDRTEKVSRVNDLWVTMSESYVWPRDSLAMIGRLPAACMLDENGQVRTDPAAACELQQTMSMEHRGYPNLTVVYGSRLVGAGGERGPTIVPVPNPNLERRLKGSSPRYVIATRRMPQDEAWAKIEEVFPRIDRRLVTLLICAFGCAQETRAGMHPFLFVTGFTGVAKTATCHVACGIFGSQTYEATVQGNDPAKWREQIWSAAKSSPIVVCNEILKETARQSHGRANATDALDPLLTLTPDSASWVSYRGPLKLGRIPAVVMTEPLIPDYIRDEAQIARRIWHYPLTGNKSDWPERIAAAGLGQDLTLLRTVSRDMPLACDSIVSQIADDWFSEPASWNALARAQGVQTILESDAFEDPAPFARELFRLVCLAPDLPQSRKKLHPGGFKLLSRTAGEEGSVTAQLAAVYGRFADGNGRDWTQSRRLTEKDWGPTLGVDAYVRVDMREDAGEALIRFAVGPMKTPTHVNQNIIDPTDWRPLE